MKTSPAAPEEPSLPWWSRVLVSGADPGTDSRGADSLPPDDAELAGTHHEVIAVFDRLARHCRAACPTLRELRAEWGAQERRFLTQAYKHLVTLSEMVSLQGSEAEQNWRRLVQGRASRQQLAEFRHRRQELARCAAWVRSQLNAVRDGVLPDTQKGPR